MARTTFESLPPEIRYRIYELILDLPCTGFVESLACIAGTSITMYGASLGHGWFEPGTVTDQILEEASQALISLSTIIVDSRRFDAYKSNLSHKIADPSPLLSKSYGQSMMKPMDQMAHLQLVFQKSELQSGAVRRYLGGLPKMERLCKLEIALIQQPEHISHSKLCCNAHPTFRLKKDQCLKAKGVLQLERFLTSDRVMGSPKPHNVHFYFSGYDSGETYWGVDVKVVLATWECSNYKEMQAGNSRDSLIGLTKDCIFELEDEETLLVYFQGRLYGHAMRETVKKQMPKHLFDLD